PLRRRRTGSGTSWCARRKMTRLGRTSRAPPAAAGRYRPVVDAAVAAAAAFADCRSGRRRRERRRLCRRRGSRTATGGRPDPPALEAFFLHRRHRRPGCRCPSPPPR
ncbi:unnamed protein product, partial [Ectocarpus sp. 12 AP-2014]